MKKEMLLAILCCGIWMFSLQSCSDDDTPTELIADDATFANYTSWVLEKTENGINSTLEAANAHNGATTDSKREIYFKDGQDAVDGIYPVGTVIAKHTTSTTDETVSITHAMVKRGEDFNASANNWEFFTFNADLTIDNRGALDGCMNCHAAATTDYVFTN